MAGPATVKRRKINPFAGRGNGMADSEATEASFFNGSQEVDALSSKFQAGNLIKLRVWNFTTYAYGEFKLSPSLNMIIGPNGSGKSTFVAAVCLGLGGKVDLIKRNKMDMMIKSGETESKIEITLKGYEGQGNVVIERKFVKKQAKSQWKVNGHGSDIEKVRALVSKLNIQLDNLCHFLPQERVAEFASLSPEKLLQETERTIGDNTLLDKHHRLIQLDEIWVNSSTNVDLLKNQIETINTEVARLEQDAQKYQEYEDKSRQVELHKKVLPYGKLQDMKERLKQLRTERETAKKALQEFDGNTRPLKDMKAKVDKKLAHAANEHNEIKNKIVDLQKRAERSTRKEDDLASSFSGAQNEIESLKSRSTSQKRELEQSVHSKEEFIRKLAAVEPIDPSESSELKAKSQAKFEEKTQIIEDRDAFMRSYNALKHDMARNETTYKEERKKLETNDRLEILRSKTTKFRRELVANSYEAHNLLRKEKPASLKYYEAPVVSCRVTDRRYAKYFEKVIDNNSLFAFFFPGEEHYKTASQVVPRKLNVPMRVLPSGVPKTPPMTSQGLRNLGFDGYLSDFITGPDALVQGLTQRSFLNFIPVALNPVSPEVLDRLTKPAGGGKPPFQKLLIGDDMIVISQSKYGSRQVFYQTERVAPAQLMGEEGLSEEMKREIQQRLATQVTQIKQMREKMESLEAERSKYSDDINRIEDEMREIDMGMKSIRKRQEAISKLEANISHIEERIKSLTKSINQDHSEQIRQKEAELLELYVSYAEASKASAAINEEFVNEVMDFKKSELLQQQMQNESICYSALMEDLDHKQEELRRIYAAAKAKCDEYKHGDAAEEIRRHQLTPEERESVKDLVQTYLDKGFLSETYIVTKITQLEEDLSVLANVDRGSLELLKKKRIDLAAASSRLPSLENERDVAKTQIEEIRVPWETELSGMVEKISQAFQKRFVTVASDGQVELVKTDRFKDWKLEILVKFRENSELKVLDHQSQSGGERAVSTIFFIMSLQGLTKAPIRIVDEINQGMDPKNEKMAHKYLVHTASKSKSSQYFLVTPKLLTGLYYHPGMTVHCIFTGPHLKKRENGEGDEFLDLRISDE